MLLLRRLSFNANILTFIIITIIAEIE